MWPECSSPSAVARAGARRELERFYAYLSLLYCNAHVYNNIVQLTEDDATVYGIFGDHQIRHILAPQASQAQEVLGDDL
jgi:hypothetical protein